MIALLFFVLCFFCFVFVLFVVVRCLVDVVVVVARKIVDVFDCRVVRSGCAKEKYNTKECALCASFDILDRVGGADIQQVRQQKGRE